VAFNNAGYFMDPARDERLVAAPLHEMSDEHWATIMDTNAGGVMRSMRAEIPVMLEQGAGVIINNASASGHAAFPGMLGYAASKHAVIGLTKVAAVELGPQNVRVVSISPLGVDTAMLRASLAHFGSSLEQASENAPSGGSTPPTRWPARSCSWPPRTPPAFTGWTSASPAAFSRGSRQPKPKDHTHAEVTPRRCGAGCGCAKLAPRAGQPTRSRPRRPGPARHRRGDRRRGLLEGGATERWVLLGDYEHHLVRTPDGWKIDRMIAHRRAELGNPELPRRAMARLEQASASHP
jgi:hypothetical protein